MRSAITSRWLPFRQYGSVMAIVSLSYLFGDAIARQASLTSPDITWDSGGTEAPDETAHGDYMALVAGAGLGFDKAHLQYLAEGKLHITRTERAVPGGMLWQVSRARPILPAALEEKKGEAVK
jgi:hypothetical protein